MKKLSGPQRAMLLHLDGERGKPVYHQQRSTVRSLQRMGLVEFVVDIGGPRGVGYALTHRGLGVTLQILFR
jgi:hypothetical protein